MSIKQRNRQRVVDYFGGACQLCGGSDHLEIQVKPGLKVDYKISDNLSCKWETLRSLLPNFMLACRRHRWRHGEHGTMSTYNNYGCRCDLCKGAWNDYLKTWRRKSRQAGAA